MLGTARKRAGATQARFPAESESPALETSTTSRGPSSAGSREPAGRPLRRRGPQVSAHAKRSPRSSGEAKAKTTPSRGTLSKSKAIDTALPLRPSR
jgi:hypothetical protein